MERFDPILSLINCYIYFQSKDKQTSCISKGTWSGEPIVNFYECKRFDTLSNYFQNVHLSTFRFGTNITVSRSTGFNHNMNINLITDKIGTKKKILCFSLLSPLNENIKIQNLAAKLNKKVQVTSFESKILNYELNNSNDKITFISFPLSYNKRKGLTLFDYQKFKKTITKTTDTADQFYNLIKLNDAKSTFESIVNVVVLFYNKYKNDYVLAYHCKSGKDRTSIFDSVVQATLMYLEKLKTYSSVNYEEIRINACKFMMFGFLIGYYGTGYFGLKLGSNKPLAKYILEQSLYNFYFGHAGKAKSSM